MLLLPYPPSEANDNSKGCKIESDLQGLVESLKESDATILAFEMRCTSDGSNVTTTEIEQAAKTTQEMEDGIKAGRKKLSALKSLWKL